MYTDGFVGRIVSENKGMTLRLEMHDLLLCKHCKYYAIDDVWSEVDGVQTVVAEQVSICKRYHDKYYMTNPDGYCYVAEKG